MPHSGLILFNSMQAKGLAATEFDSSLRAPAAEILPVPKMRKGARQSACMPERESALLDPYPSGHRDDHRFVIAMER